MDCPHNPIIRCSFTECIGSRCIQHPKPEKPIIPPYEQSRLHWIPTDELIEELRLRCK